MASQDIDQLVSEVLQAKFSEPYPENIIDEVFHAIQQSPEWLNRFQVLCAANNEHGVVATIGKVVKAITKLEVIKARNKSRYRNSLNKNYSTLGKPRMADTPAEPSR